MLTWLDRLFLSAVFIGVPLVFTMPYLGVSRAALLGAFGPFVALALIPYLFGFVIRGFRRLGIGLTPEGVYHWEWFGCSFYGWDEIRYTVPIREHKVEIVVHLVGKRGVDHEGQYERVPEESWLNKYQWYRNRASRINAGQLAVNPALMLEALAFYHANPELRPELGTQAAVDRFRHAAFPVSDWS